MRLSIKKISSAILAVITAFSLQLPAIAATNPFTLEGTNVITGSTEFTIQVSIPKATHMDSYGIIVFYDTDKLAITGDEGSSYRYTQDFTNQYAKYGQADLNVRKEAGEVIFAGASISEEHVSYSGLFAEITFQILDNTLSEENVLSSLKLSLDSLTLDDVEVDITGMETTYPIVITDAYMLGDLDNDGDVDLDDVNLALKGALTIVKLSPAQTKAADVAGNDNNVTLDDVNLILKAALTIIEL